jgi:predicted MFS family arabinose efflux permease
VVPRNPSVARLSAVTFLVAAGAGLYGAVSTLLFTRPGALTPASFSAALAIAGVTGSMCAAVSGRVIDRVGAFSVAIAFTSLQAIAMLLYPLAASLALFLSLAVIFMIASQVGSTARGSLVALAVDRSARSEARGYTFAAASLGMALGGVAGAVTASARSYFALQAALVTDAILLAFAAAVLLKLRRHSMTAGQPSEGWTRQGKIGIAARSTVPENPLRRTGPSYLAALCGGIFALSSPIIPVALPVWAVSERGIPPYWIGLWGTLSTLIITALHVKISKLSEGRGSVRTVIVGATLLFVAASLLAIAHFDLAEIYMILLITAAVALIGVGSSAVAAATWSVSYSLATDAEIGHNQGIFNASIGLSSAVAPAILVYLASLSNGQGWLLLGVVLLLAGAILARIAAHELPH